jgi:hypothetical protein
VGRKRATKFYEFRGRPRGSNCANSTQKEKNSSRDYKLLTYPTACFAFFVRNSQASGNQLCEIKVIRAHETFFAFKSRFKG